MAVQDKIYKLYLESSRDCKELALFRPIAKYTIVPRLFLQTRAVHDYEYI